MDAPLPLSALADPKIRQLVQISDLVFGVDSVDGHETLFYGRDLVNKVADGGRERPTRVIRFRVDYATEELEYLCAVLLKLKGGHCYHRESDSAEE